MWDPNTLLVQFCAGEKDVVVVDLSVRVAGCVLERGGLRVLRPPPQRSNALMETKSQATNHSS
jgi:hypothetical protein